MFSVTSELVGKPLNLFEARSYTGIVAIPLFVGTIGAMVATA
jgi:hypothetical protein